MERVVQFLKEAETYYLATVEGDQPRVRPFGTAHIFEVDCDHEKADKAAGTVSALYFTRSGGNKFC